MGRATDDGHWRVCKGSTNAGTSRVSLLESAIIPTEGSIIMRVGAPSWDALPLHACVDIFIYVPHPVCSVGGFSTGEARHRPDRSWISNLVGKRVRVGWSEKQIESAPGPGETSHPASEI